LVTRVCVSVCLSVCLCLSVAACPHYCTDPNVTWGNGRGGPLVVYCWADLQSVRGFRCYDNIARTRNVSECLYSLYAWFSYCTSLLLLLGHIAVILLLHTSSVRDKLKFRLIKSWTDAFWATVCKTVRPMLSDRCLSCLSVCLSVTLVYCGQTV